MRRPPDKEGPPVLSQRDVDSSNSTLNTLFGGSRQKSWMLGPGTPVRPTPRTNTSRPDVPLSTMAEKTTAAVLLSPTPSPVLANTCVNTPPRNGDRRETHNEHVRPGPAHTVPGTIQWQQAPQNEARNALVRVSLSRPSSSSNRSPSESRGQSVTSVQFNESTTPSAIIDNPPLPASVFLPSDRRQVSEDVLSPMEAPTPPAPASDQYPRRSPSNPFLYGLGITTRHFVPSPIATHRVPPGSSHRHSRGTTQSASPDMRNFQPSTTLQHEVQSYPSPTTSAPNPNKRQRTQVAVMPSLRPRVVLIDKHIELSGGPLNLNSGLERPRFQLLTDACKTDDVFYVALHQVFCVWDINSQEVAGIEGFPDVNVLEVAFKVLAQLIRENDQLAPNHKNWFAQFPSPLKDLLRTSEPYRRTVMTVGIFLQRLPMIWSQFTKECPARHFPPLVDEMVNRMGLLSPILQGVVFTAMRRNLGFSEEEVGARMEALFQRDRREHQAIAARVNTASPPTEKEIRDRTTALIGEHLMIYNQVEQQRASQLGGHLNSGLTPVVPSNVPASPSLSNMANAPRIQQRTDSRNSWHENAPVPDPNWRSANQQLRTTNTSPNPLLGRPSSVTAQRVYSNSNISNPSYIMQDLSMDSPTRQGPQFPHVPTNNTQVYSLPSPHLGNFHVVGSPNTEANQHQAHIAMQQQQIAYQQQQIAAQHQMQPQYQVAAQPNWQQSSHQPQFLATQQQDQLQLHQHRFYRATGQVGTVPLQQDHARRLSSESRHSPLANPSPRLIGLPAPASSTIPNNGQLHHDSLQYEAKHPLHRPIIPPLGYRHPSQPMIPDVVALHQALLRSPHLVAADRLAPGVEQESPVPRYYQAIRGFALPPTRISMNTPLSKFDFRVSEAELALVPKDVLSSQGQPPEREFKRGTLQFRLRCIQTKKSDTKCSIAEWVLKDTVWPESASLSINKKHLEIRRKSHHGTKDLPLDVTPLVHLHDPHGISQISLSILRGRTKMKESSYFIAVEVVEILQHDQILQMAKQNHISADITLNKIKSSHAGPTHADEDEIAMVVSDISIDLADPFTARIFDLPVRGASCLHRECFDLETFLETRKSKAKRQGQPCLVDAWKCPLCSGDARPYGLQIDGFLVSVREKLEAEGNLDVKAIWVGPDGEWRPKVEYRTGQADSDDSSDGEGAPQPDGRSVSRQTGQARRTSRAVEVIDLD